MGQYYRFILLSESGAILHWIHPHDFDSGSKMMEFSWLDNEYVAATESILASKYYRIVCAGDYGAPEDDSCKNLYHMCDDVPELRLSPESVVVSKLLKAYIVNHTKKQYVNKLENKHWDPDSDWKIHPLPLLVSETTGSGGGDFRGTGEMDVGIWARDVISLEAIRPGADYSEFRVGFCE